MKLVIKYSLKLFVVLLFCVLYSCKKVDSLSEPLLSDTKSFSKALRSSNQLSKVEQLVKGIAGTLGSTVGPAGDLFVPDPVVGSILRINPKTGDYHTFASGLPQMIPEIGLGGITDVTFLDEKAYALVTLIDDPDLFPTGQINGIYRIDGANSYSIIADIGAYNLAHPPTGFDFFVSTGVLYAIQTYHDGFLVTDGHLNRVLYVTLDGNISEVRKFNNIVPTGMDVKGNMIYLSQAGPVPHLPINGKVLSFSIDSPEVANIASGAPLLVDVEFGRGQSLFALSQGEYGGGPEGSPALPNTGSFVRVNDDGTLSVIADQLNIPTSFEIIGNTAYIFTLTGEVWTVDNIAGPPFGLPNRKHLLLRYR